MEQVMTAKHGGEANILDDTGLCLLSLDGGGVRGLSSLYILKSVMDRLNHARKKGGNLSPVKPCEVFDLIGGTSTGGLIAIMLGRLEMDVDECIAAYSELASKVFREKQSRIPVTINGKTKPRFDSTKLKSAIEDVATKCGASGTDLFNDASERGCKTFVCAADHDTKDIIRLRSYSLPHEPSVAATICQAALATSAATTFFEPVRIGNRTFADGGLGANNPVDEVEGEASNIWCTDTGNLKPLVKCFISIGTGNPGKKAFEGSIISFLAETLVEIATETENTERKFMARWAGHFDENRYFRFNVDQGLQDVGLDEYEKLGPLEAATSGYISHPALKFRVRDCVQNLRLKQSKTHALFEVAMNEYTLRTHQKDSVRHKTCCIVPFERNPHFTGRESELAQMEEKMFQEDRTAKIAIMGLGGVGKTQIALELIYRTRQKYKHCSILWIPAINMETVQQAYLHIAKKLSIPGMEEDKTDVMKLVQEYLSEERAGQWLLVFDNADDIDMWIGRPGRGRGANSLVEYLPRSNQVEVQEMDLNAATQLLQKSLSHPELVDNEGDTKALLIQLTRLPLAIIQAAAYINENSIGLADYLSLLDEQEEEVIDLLSEEFEDDWRYRNIKNPVATTWLLSFEQIRLRDPLAAEFLSFIACVDPKDVPRSLLPPGASKKKEIDAIGTLDAYSFINRRHADDAFDVHRLVHRATRNWLRQNGLLCQWTNRTARRLQDIFPDNDHQNRAIWRRYMAHALYVLDSNIIESSEETRIRLARKVASCLWSDGRFREAEVLFSEVMETTQIVRGPNHPEILTLKAWLASIYRGQGRWKEAEDLGVEVMETMKRVLGEEHPDTLTSMNNLALTYSSQGRWKEAEDLGVEVMEMRKRVLGEEYPDTLTSMGHLTLTYSSQGPWKEAEDLEVEVM